MDASLNGRVAAITGASSGLGHRFALKLSEAGVSVALLARRTDRLDKLVEDIESRGGRAMACPLDVADTDSIRPALEKAEARLGPLSIMINNAGVSGDGMALDMTSEQFDQTFAVNVRGVFFGAREAARLMLANGSAKAGQARIINIASIAAFTQLPALSVYCASKAAVVSLTKSLAREWARDLIAVNAICPGYIETEINSAWFKTEGGQKQISRLPRRRLIDADALDAVLMMLAGDPARQITGSAFSIDDGQIL
ncbi:SDR family NAD(P)-dependent oxidoreductase [Marinicauda pacifica]|jgi:NAD(P)-dependent dehydrogenase (short-subunit alcohol dehydrogenase family)|uniref:SDR family NAD(P)-dependent oxidoreductase n=1 Tax=Marinicauda pacifica TaxID=1133559 RepID=UPI0035C7CC10